jgi:hypothetical protein
MTLGEVDYQELLMKLYRMVKKGGMIRNVSAQDERYGSIFEQRFRGRRSASTRHDTA